MIMKQLWLSPHCVAMYDLIIDYLICIITNMLLVTIESLILVMYLLLL